MAKKKLVVSFSMGKSSAVMCKLVQDFYAEAYEIIFVCANTTWELQESIDFGKKVDEFLKLDCKVIESVTHFNQRKSSSHKVVTWDTADMKQTAFENMIKKYGIPNKAFPHCTRELKTNPIKDYLKSIGWENYYTAIGFRYDEIDRVPEDYEKRRFIFPLIDHKVTKEEVYRYFTGDSDRAGFFPFTLKLREHEGNCQACFKKSNRKLLTIATEYPDRLDFPKRMEQEYPRVGAEFKKDYGATDRKFFRGNKSTEELIADSANFNNNYVDALYEESYSPDELGCQESCEAF